MEEPASDTERSPPRSELSIDDLALGRRGAEDQEPDADADADGSESSVERGDDAASASGMETKLRRNLRAQQAHYARQRRLFEGLRADTAMSPPPSACHSSPSSSPSSQGSSSRPTSAIAPVRPARALAKSTRFKLELPQPGGAKWRSGQEDKGESARDAVRRVQDRALADYKRRIAYYRAPPHREKVIDTADSTHRPLAEEMEQQEASNDALRRQLELLRRLQLDNNRFRVENRTLRERTDTLGENLSVRDREIRLLREEVADKNARISRDRENLADAAQTAKRLKTTQRQLAAAHEDMDKLREALDDALKAQGVADTKAQEQLVDAASEMKRLKRINKQLKQREKALQDDIEGYRGSIEELEQTAGELRTRLHDLKHEKNKLAAQLADKSERYDRFETSTTECVHRLQDQVAALQKSQSDDRARLEAQESELDRLEGAVRDKDAQLSAREQEHANAQHKFQDRRRAYREHVAALEEKLELSISNQRADAETIGSLRRQCETIALQVAAADERAVDAGKRAQEETRTLRRAVDSMRKYIEEATSSAAVGEGDAATDDAQLLLPPRREPTAPDDRDDWDSAVEAGEEAADTTSGEFQVVHAAVSALRHAVMDSVHELQRVRHVARQQAHKATSQQARTQDMERRLDEDAAALKREQERRVLAEQARDIALKEKGEVLQWSEQACHKAEALESQLAKCESAVTRWLRKLSKALRLHDSGASQHDDEEEEEEKTADLVSTLLPRADKRLGELLSVTDDLRRAREQQTREILDLKDVQRRLESEMDDKTLDAKRVLAEVEALHARSVEEVKERLREQVADAEGEVKVTKSELAAAKARVAELSASESELQHQLTALESDVPVLAAVAHLFAATVRPLIQQVSDLTVQKRLLRSENADYVQQFDQIKCVGQVLKEMLPPVGSSDLTDTPSRVGRRPRQCFRRAVIAVFAANRLRGFAVPLNHSRDADSRFSCTVYGVSTALLASSTAETKARTWLRSLEAPPPVIKVLPLKETVARLPLRTLLERLRPLRITEMLARAMEAEDAAAGKRHRTAIGTGGLVLQVLSAMDASASDLLLQNVSGAFHCQALLERRRRYSSHHAPRAAGATAWRRTREREYEDSERGEDDLPVVELIQQRIIALGKRVEDLHFQRNSLQKENYEFQFQLEQQAAGLTEMQRLTRNVEELQAELAGLREYSSRNQSEMQAACDKQSALVVDKARELDSALERIAALERQLQRSEDDIAACEGEKAALAQQIEQLRQQGADEEAKADKTRADARRQQEETRQLKQTIKRAHELYQKAQTKLEQETMERASLQARLDHLRSKHEQLERELREERRREVERSFDDGDAELIGRRSSRSSTMEAAERRADRAPRSPVAASFDDLIVRRPKNGAIADDTDEDDAVCEVTEASDGRRARHAASSENFMREWRQLDVSTAFRDAPPATESDNDGEEQRDTEEPTPAAPASPPAWLVSSPSVINKPSPASGASSIRKPSTRAELAQAVVGGRSRRAVEIDKVNAAVHDYMDRIDDKLSKMYGIPPSAAISRDNHSPLVAAHASGAGEEDVDGDSDDDIDEIAKRDDVRRLRSDHR